MKSRQWTLAAYPERETSLSDFRLVERELPPPAEGEALVKICWIGLAPSLRFRMTAGGAGLPGMAIGDPITSASGVGIVIDSRRAGIVAGDVVYGDVGWADYANIGAGRYLVPIGREGKRLTNPRGVLGEVSSYTGGTYRPEDFIGLLGGVAMAAWIGLDLVAARAGETVVVTAAAGGIGHVACQIAHQAGLDVIGLTRGAEKGRWLKESLPFVTVLDAADPDVVQHIPPYDVLFENVGGAMLMPLLSRIRKYGRLALCGVIAEYETEQSTPLSLAPLVFKDLSVHGYFADDYLPKWVPAMDALGRWLTEGKFTRGYDIEDAVERLPEVYLRLFRGATNRGKLMLRVADL